MPLEFIFKRHFSVGYTACDTEIFFCYSPCVYPSQEEL